jgi:hypothetical protein
MSSQEKADLVNDDANDRMCTFFTGRTKKQRTSRERAIKFPLKVRSLDYC